MYKIKDFFKIILNIKSKHYFKFFVYLDEKGEIIESEITSWVMWKDELFIRSTTRKKAEKRAWKKLIQCILI